MNLTHVLAVAAIGVSALVALMVAYWQRKQMRQIEAYRVDPSVGLVPPPSPLWTFVASRQYLFISILPIGSTVLLIYYNVQVTIWTVLGIAFNCASLVLIMTLYVFKIVVSVLGGISEVQGIHLAATEKVVQRLASEKQSRPAGA